jgi:very-short-patch-repair endonuclease
VIRLNEPCYWRPKGDGGVACLKCVTGKIPNDRQIPGGQQGEWHNLVKFLRDSVLVSSIADLMAPEEFAEYELIEFANVLRQDARGVTAAGAGLDRAKRRAERRDEGPLTFGWPILVQTNPLNALKCAPIFVATITVELSSENHVALTRESSFALNPALTSSEGIGLSLAEELQRISDDLSQAVLTDLVTKVASDYEIPLRGFADNSVEIGENVKDGIYNSATLMAGDSAATANLLRELDELVDRTDWQHTAAASLVSGAKAANRPIASSLPMVAPLTINHAQEAILTKTMSAGTTVVTGPPGTGKSQVVVDLVANAWTHGQSILVTSTNNAAVDVAVTRANLVAPGLAIRTGNKSAREAIPDIVAQLVNGAQQVSPTERAAAEGNLFRTTNERDTFFKELSRCGELENLHQEQLQEQERLAAVVSGYGVIEISDGDLTEILRRTQRLKNRTLFLKFRWKRYAKKHGLRQEFESIGPTTDWLRSRVHNLNRQREIEELHGLLGDIDIRSQEVEVSWQTACTEMTRSVVTDTIARNKSRFSSLSQARSSYYGTLKAIETIAPHLKGWACTTLSLHQNFPLHAGLFDYVIVDEASQCQLAYVLPAAFRAKRLILVGDPNQLPPISQITMEQEISIAMKNHVTAADLNRRRLSSNIYSAFDFFANVVGDENVDLLNEHYRSHPHIARWFNETFYGSELKVLTDISNVANGSRSLTWIDTPGLAVQPAKGSWVNEAEAKQVIDIIEEYVATRKTIGVVTPFSAQASLIEQLAMARIGRDQLGEVAFRSGTAHSFQGDERDVMVFSCVLADGISRQAAKWVQSERRLINVAVSRARETLIVVGNPDIGAFECPTLTSLHMFAKTVHEFADSRIGPRIDSEAERRLYEAMLSAGLDPLSKVDVEGYELDFGLITSTDRIDIEVDGDQHYERTLGSHLKLRRQDIARDRVISRAGWKVERIPAWECIQYPERVAARLFQIASNMNPSLPD